MMPKGYWIARLDINDPDSYKTYLAANDEAIRSHGGRFLVRGGRAGDPAKGRVPRNIVLEFPSYQAALACWNSPAYRRALPLQTTYPAGDFVIIEGCDDPQS